MDGTDLGHYRRRWVHFWAICFRCWLKFKGGKGVATYIGILLRGLPGRQALVFCAVWIAVAVISRYSSLSALVSSAVTTAISWFTSTPAITLLAILTVLLWITASRKHHPVAQRNRRQDRQTKSVCAMRCWRRNCERHQASVTPSVLDWLRLIRSENVGPRTFRSLLQSFWRRAQRSRRCPISRAVAVANRAIKIYPEADAQRELDNAHRRGVTFVALGESTLSVTAPGDRRRTAASWRCEGGLPHWTRRRSQSLARATLQPPE